MALRTCTIDDKVAACEAVIEMLRQSGFDREHPTAEAMKALASDVRARRELPRSKALGDLDRMMRRLVQSKTEHGYDEIRMIAVANAVVQHWPTISQALEQFGEESAE